MKKGLLLILAGLGATWAFDKYKSAGRFIDKAHLELIDIGTDPKKFVASGFTAYYFKAKVVIVNPTDFNVLTEGIFIDVMHNGHAIGHVYDMDKVLVPKYKKTVIDVEIKVVLAELAAAIADALKTGIDNGIELEIHGKVNFTVGTLTIIKKIKL